MSDPVRELLEEALDSDRTPEEVCRDRPELLTAVRARWVRLKALDAQLDAVFPTPHSTPADRPRPTASLPRIPGYEIEGLLGRGGMGVVYRGRHRRLNRPVAVKMLLAGAYASRRDLARFQREAEAVAALRHPNVVSVFDVGDLDGLPYYTMEFVEGGSLARQMAGAPQPAARAADLVATLAGAVEAAHRGGIVHRDLKPGNILLLADGTPKVSDFGLARRFDGPAGDTRTGTGIGTPSYMAPEQATGHAGPPADVYSLGAILYEMLTGRPPFRAETPSATVHQLLVDDPVPPSRLNRTVPRDLETICLKCLHKDPARRYPTAAALADDLTRFRRGESIAARRAGPAERAWKWLRRRPGPAAAVGVGLALVVTLAVGGWWWAADRSETRRDVAEDLDAAVQAQRRSDWAEARTALVRARARLGDRDLADFRARTDRGSRDLELAARLDAIRLNRHVIFDGYSNRLLDRTHNDREYEAVFADLGVGSLLADPEAVAAAVRESNIARAIVAALDDWAVCAVADERRRWLMEVARRADPDPTGDLARLRDPAAWEDRAALAALTEPALAAKPSLQLLVALGERLRALNGDAVPFLTRVQAEHPGDFWANFALADALCRTRPAEAVRYYQAALAIRPAEAIIHHDLGRALAMTGRLDEALARFEQSLALDTRFANAASSYGNALSLVGRHDEALAQHRRAVATAPRLDSVWLNFAAALLRAGRAAEAVDQLRELVRRDPNHATARTNLGYMLHQTGRLDEAVACHQQALAIDPACATAETNLGFARAVQGHRAEAMVHYRRALRIDPTDVVALTNLGNCLRIEGRVDEAVLRFREALRLNSRYAPAHSGLATTLAKGGPSEESAYHFRQAAELAPTDAKAQFNLGLALAEGGRPDQAIPWYERAIAIDPKLAEAHGSLGEALLSQGRAADAKAAFGKCLDLLPATHPKRPAVAELVRRCDPMIAREDRLPAVLAGTDRPANAAERLHFADLCGARRQSIAAVRLYAEVFAAKPHWAEDLRAGPRFRAALAAARAGCAGPEAGSADERAGWREQARAWLRADLDAWTKKLDDDPTGGRPLVRQTLTRWRDTPDFGRLRELDSLAAYPVAERAAWLALWADADALLAKVRKGE
jgi:eukaryotic-like serine/threonine-protein kinase